MGTEEPSWPALFKLLKQWFKSLRTAFCINSINKNISIVASYDPLKSKWISYKFYCWSLFQFLDKETESLGALKVDGNNIMVWRKPLRAYQVTKLSDLAKCSFSLFKVRTVTLLHFATLSFCSSVKNQIIEQSVYWAKRSENHFYLGSYRTFFYI